MADAQLKVLDNAGTFPKAVLFEPNSFGYVQAGAVVDRRPPFGYALEGRRKRRLLTELRAAVADLRADPVVREAVAFKALVRPPGRGAFLKERPNVHIARYDVAVWVETDDPGSASQLLDSPAWRRVETSLRAASSDVHVVAGHNGRRLGDVDHSRDGVFLMNYFYADDAAVNLKVWEYTAGWFQDQTGLDNSLLLVPNGGTDYTFINHCRWDKLRDILPALFKPSFRRYVLAHFEANNTAATPILYRLA